MPECLDPNNNFRPNSRCMGYGFNWGSNPGWASSSRKGDGLVRPQGNAVVGVGLAEVVEPSRCLFYGDTNDYAFITLLRDAMPGVRDPANPTRNLLGKAYEPPRHGEGNQFVFVDGHVEWLRFPGGKWVDGGAWVIPDMSKYSRTGRWEPDPVP